MKKIRFHLNFKTKLITIISLFTIVLVLCISGFNYFWHLQQLTRQTINQTQQIIEQTGANIDNYIDELFRLTLSPYYNDDIMTELASEVHSPEEMLTQKRTIENFLSSVMTLPRDEVLRVYILTDNNIYSYTRTPYQMQDYNSYKEADWYQKALSSNSPVFIPIHSEKAFGEKETQIFSIARRLRSKEDNELVLGVIKVDADYTGIKSICDKIHFEHNGTLLVINTDGDIVYQNSVFPTNDVINAIDLPTSAGDYNQVISGERYIVNTTTLTESGLRVIAIHSYETLTEPAKINLRNTILLALTCIIGSVIFLIFFIKKFFNPLSYIINSMKTVQTGDLSIRVPVEKQDEIGYLADSFNTMISNLSNVIHRNTELNNQVHEARYLQKVTQYNALYSQIKPHFLHNTLNTISLLIKCNEYRKAVICIENLSHFLRGIMNTDKEILLNEELSIVTAYLDLQKIRYGDRLDYEIQIPEQFREIVIPALSLQPLIENVIKHCCETSSSSIHLLLSCKIESEHIWIYVKDNGPGITQNRLIDILKKLHSEDESPLQSNLEESIGLLNVHRRLRLKFGQNAALSISSDANGTTVSLIIPITL